MSTFTVAQALTQALSEEMHRDPRVLLLGEGVATTRPDLLAAFGPSRVRNTPLAEGVIAGTAVGAAAMGLRPVIDLLFAPFMTLAMDALINSAGKLRYLSGGQFNFPLVALAKTGSGWCVGGQHNHNLEAMFVHAPGLKVVMPSRAADTLGLLKSANPVLFFTDLALLPCSDSQPLAGAGLSAEPQLVPIGQAAVLRRGRDATLISYGKTVAVCEQAASQLAQQGINVELIDLRSLKPLDEHAVLTSARKTGRVVVVHEAAAPCGVGAEVAALVAERAFARLRAPMRRLTGPDAPAAASWALEQAAVPSAAAVVDAVRSQLGLRPDAQAEPDAVAHLAHRANLAHLAPLPAAPQVTEAPAV
jgi:acetoin:2,6-dichlorophenolindophenol oxidoreductase subunit beta